MKLKRVFAALLSIALCLSFCTPAMAANERGVTYSTTLSQTSVDQSSEAQEVTLAIAADQEIRVNGLQATVYCTSPLELVKIESTTLTGFTAGSYNLPENDKQHAYISWYQISSEEVPAVQLLKVTVRVPANTVPGAYKIGFSELRLTEGYGTEWEKNGEGCATLTVKEVIPPTEIPSPITVSGLAAPVKGEVPGTTAVLPEGMTAGTIIWTPADARFAPATAYTATIPYTLADNCVLPAGAEVTPPAGALSARIDTEQKQIIVTYPVTEDKSAQTITAGDVTMTYGDTDASVSASASGALSFAVKAGSEAYLSVDSTGRLTAKKVGTAYVTVTAAATEDYAAASKDVAVTIEPKTITVTASVSAAGLIYNGKAQTPAVTAASTDAVLTAGDYTVVYSDNINAGTATATVRAKAGSNYTFRDVPATFTIGQATITISADDKSAYVGEMAPVPTFTVRGLLGTDKLAAQPRAEYVSAPDMSKTGTSVIRVAGAEAPAGGNYTIVYVDGTLTVTAKPSGSITGSTVYTITVRESEHGSLKSDRRTAASGTLVTVTVQPENGWQLAELTVTGKDGKYVSLTDLGNGKHTFVMPAANVTVEASFAQESAGSAFADVKPGDFFYDAVQWAVEKKVTTGTSATAFDPYASCTRSQIVTFLWRAAGSPMPQSTENPFTDVSNGDYYYYAVLWAVENGVTQGTSAASFSPNAVCTRGQAVTFLCRVAGSDTATSVSAFTDVASDAYYAAAVAWAVENGVTKGTSASTFSPDASCTRAEIVTFLYRADRAQ